MKERPSNRQLVNKSLVWGAAYGAVWSLAPGIVSELMRDPGEAATVILSGSITGALVACVLSFALVRSKLWQALLLGVLSLPLGAGLFGFIISCIHWVVMIATGTHYRFVMQIVDPPGYIFAPLESAGNHAVFSILSPFGLVFIPLAVLTTLHLRWRLSRFRISPPS